MDGDRIEIAKSADGFGADLNGLLAMDRMRLVDAETGLFDQLTGSGTKPLLLFGAGGLGRKTLAALAGTGLQAICFGDNAAARQGGAADGLPVLSAADGVAKYRHSAVFVVTIYIGYEEVIEQLKKLGAETIVPFYVLFWKYPNLFLPHYAYDLPHRVIDEAAKVRAAGELLDDIPSLEEYVAQVNWRLDPVHAVVPPQDAGVIYFPHDLVSLRDDEVFVDCGGYDGDTMLSFLNQVGGQFSEAYVFEPDPRNLVNLERALASLPHPVRSRIHVEEIAVGKSSGSVAFQLSDAASTMTESGDLIVRCEPLDQLLAGLSPTFLKMDIEGAEIDALVGARDLISASRPVLAISAYHLQDHLWTIPLLIDSFVKRYRYYYRRYTRQPNDDLVLYAIPEERWSRGEGESGAGILAD